MSAVNPLPTLRKQFAGIPVAKRVQVEVLSQDNKRVIHRFRFAPPNDAKTGHRTRFTAEGVDQVLENFVDSFERDNPNHRYRLVVCKDKYKLVWEPEESGDPVIGTSGDRNAAQTAREIIQHAAAEDGIQVHESELAPAMVVNNEAVPA